MSRACLLLMLVAASGGFPTAPIVRTTPAQAPPNPSQPTVVVTLNGGPPLGVTVFVVIDAEKHAGLAQNLPRLSGKFAKGASIDVYRRVCETGAIEVILLPAGEPLGAEDKDCYKAKEPPPGAPCRCGWIGAFSLGQSATIDADTGKVK